MNGKNLPLKFAFVALVVAVCLWSVLYGKKLRWGIDLQGGHSLIFEIRTREMELNRLRADKKDLEAKREKAVADRDEAEHERLELAVKDKEEQIKRYEEAGADPSDLSERLIAILKNRIDPDGLRGTEWRPMGKNRFEVRIPAGSKETQGARDAYYRELEALKEGNLNHRKLRLLLEAPASKQEQMLSSLAHDDAAQIQRLGEVISSYKQLKQADARLEQAEERLKKAIERFNAVKGTPEEAKAKQEAGEASKEEENAKSARDKAAGEHEGLRKDALERGRIEPEELRKDVLAYYVSHREAAGSRREAHRKEVQRRRAVFAQRVNELVDRFPTRKAQIERVVEAYKGWVNKRRYFEDPADLKRLIAKAGVLEFRIVPYLPVPKRNYDLVVGEEEFQEFKKLMDAEGPEGVRKRNGKYIWLPLQTKAKRDDFSDMPVVKHTDGKLYILVFNQEGFVMFHERGPGGWSLTSAKPSFDEMNRPAVKFEFEARGSRLFGALTEAHRARDGRPGHALAVVLDDEVYSAPAIKTKIYGRGIITGRFTRQEVEELARTLEAGSLPAKLNPDPVAENSFGPAIGEVNRQRGFRAGVFGLIAVAVFMLVYYLLAGSIANVALMLNVILVLGAMSLFSAVFTLPGIAGVILTIGMAVDANVLIFERLREEQAKGQSVQMTIKNAYERAFSAIFDANVTTLLVCLILGWVGSEEVRGFAITLTLGVLFSMFTALVVTRWIFQMLLNRRLVKGRLLMLQLVGTPKINWMSKRHFFWGLSLAFVVLGVASLIWQGSGILGIEFTSGTQAVVRFRDDAVLRDPSTGREVLPNDALVYDLLAAEAGRGQTREHERLVTARVEKLIDRERARNFLNGYDRNGDGKITRGEWKESTGDPKFFEFIDTEPRDGELTLEELKERLPAEAYQITTTVNDPTFVRRIISDAYGKALEVRTPCEFKKAAAGRVEELGIDVDQRGAASITESLLKDVDPKYRYDIEDFVGGVLFVIRDVEPAVTRAELSSRIQDMRAKIDFAELSSNETEVVGLAPGAEGGYKDFLVAVRPAEPVEPLRITEFMDKEAELLTVALQSAEAGDIRNIDAAIAGEMRQRAIFAIILSWVAIVAYLWFRFGSARWGLAAVICLIHDVVIVVGLVAVSGWLHGMFFGRLLGIDSFKIDLPMIAAFLAVIGYSVNDTIVVFDRIRENRGKLTSVSPDVINRSINQTISRTLLTSCTTLIVVVVMYVWGGQGIHAFSYALLAGVLFGTYSSVAVASPLLLGFKKALVARTVGEQAIQGG